MRDYKSKGTTVFLKEGEDINRALKRFKNKVADAGTLDTLREKEFYVKPSEARKRAKGAGRARHLKRLRSQQLPPKLY